MDGYIVSASGIFTPPQNNKWFATRVRVGYGAFENEGRLGRAKDHRKPLASAFGLDRLGAGERQCGCRPK